MKAQRSPRRGRRLALSLSVAAAAVATAVFLGGGVANAGACQGGATKNWSGAGLDNLWHNPNNWLPVGVPGASDHVCIDLAIATVDYTATAGTTSILSLDAQDPLAISGGTLNLTDTTTDSEATSLTLSGTGTRGGAGKLIVQPAGSMTWSGGSLVGVGTTQISSTATLAISGADAKTINNHTIDNDGATTWTGTGNINSGNSAVIDNSGTFDIQNNLTMLFNQGGNRLQFNNTGALTKSGGVAGFATLAASVDNDGTVSVTSGSLILGGGTTFNDDSADLSTGDFSATAGEVLTFASDGPAHRLGGPGSSVTGAGIIEFFAGTSHVGVEDYDVGGTTLISGGTANFNTLAADTPTTEVFSQSSGTLGGTGLLIVGDTAEWFGGTMASTGTLRIDVGSTMTIGGLGTKTLNNHTIDNDGTTACTSVTINSGNSAVIDNSGTFHVANTSMLFNQGGNRLQINNTGTFTKSSGAGTSNLQASMDNDGIVTATSGFLVLNGGTTFNDDVADPSTGDFSATAGDTLIFGSDGPAHRLSGAGSSVTGAGTVFFLSGTSHVGVEDYDVTGETVIDGGTANFNTLPADTPTTEDFTLDFGGTLGGTGLLAVGDQGTWTGGSMVSTGTLQIDVGSTMAISGDNPKTLNNHTLDNDGTTTWTGTGDLNVGNSAVIDNSGLFDIQNDEPMTHNQGGNLLQINNTGTLTKSAGSGTSDLQAAVDNDGTVTSASGSGDGTLRLGGGTTFNNELFDFSTGDFSATAGDTLSFGSSGPNHRLGPGAGSSVTGAGTIDFSSGGTSLVAVEDYDVTGLTQIAGGTANFNTLLADTPTTEGFTLSSGNLGGTGILTVGNAGSWTGGSMVSSGTLRIDVGSTLAISGAATKTLNNHTLDNDGTTSWTGTGDLDVGNSAVIDNSGTFDIQTNADMVFNQGGSRLQFNNSGTLIKSVDLGATQLSISVDNDGTVTSTSGYLLLGGGTTFDDNVADASTGDFSATAGDVLAFGSDGPAHRLSGAGSSITGAGIIRFSSGTSHVGVEDYAVTGSTQIFGGTANFNTLPAETPTTEEFWLGTGTVGGTLGGTGLLTVGDVGLWEGGSMANTGTLQIDVGSTLAIFGTEAKTLNNHTLDNDGTTTWTGTGDLDVGNSAVIDNSGLFDIQNDEPMVHNQGGNTLQINNSGTFTKSAGSGTSDIQAAMDNDGAGVVSSASSGTGHLRLGSGTTFNNDPADASTGDFSATAGDTLSFGSGGPAHRLGGAGSSVTGAGIISFTSGTSDLGVDVDYEVTGTTAISGGTANFNTGPALSPTTTSLDLSSGTLGGTGELTVPGNATWTGGSMANSGTTIFSGTLGISGSADKTINAHTMINSGTATWSGTGNINSGNGAVIDNSGTFLIDNNQSMLYNQGGARLIFNNSGDIARITGTGVAELQATVDNTPSGGGEGTISVNAGTLYLNGTGSLADYNATTDTLNDGIYIVASSTFKFTDADIDVNAAIINLAGATSAIVDHNDVDALGDFGDNQGAFAILDNRDLTSTLPVTNSGAVAIGSNSTFTSTGDYTQTTGETDLSAASSELVATGGCVEIQDGVLKGIGTAEPCVDVTGGNVQPGFSAGILDVDGTYDQSSAALDIEIGGTTAGTGHDQLAVTGAATLGGTLALDTIGSFTPSAGDSFMVMTFASRTGTFSSATWSDLPAGLGFTVTYNSTNVTVSVSSTTPTVSIGDASVTEGDAGTVNADFTVTLSAAAPAGGVTVEYDTADGTASSLSDYVAESDTVTFAEGDDTETISIAVNGDIDDESNETFTVDLSNPSGATIADSQGVGTITDDDGTASADLRVFKHDTGREPKPLARGFRYGIRVINFGPDGATEVTVVDTLPDEVVFVSYRSTQGTCTEDTGVVTCDLGSLASGAFAKVSILVRTVGSGTATNTVTVSAAESDPVLANNSDSEDTSIAP